MDGKEDTPNSWGSNSVRHSLSSWYCSQSFMQGSGIQGTSPSLCLWFFRSHWNIRFLHPQAPSSVHPPSLGLSPTQYLQRSVEDIGFHGPGVMDGYEAMCGLWEPNPSPQQKQALLTAEPSLQFPQQVFPLLPQQDIFLSSALACLQALVTTAMTSSVNFLENPWRTPVKLSCKEIELGTTAAAWIFQHSSQKQKRQIPSHSRKFLLSQISSRTNS